MKRALLPAGLGLLLASSAVRGESPEISYMLECQGCHRADGTGLAGEVPSLAGQLGRFLTVPGGREFLVRVPGSAQSALSDAELAEVLNWMVRRFGPEPVARDFVPYSAEEVARFRQPPLSDVESVRRSLLEEIAARSASAPPRKP